MSDIMLLLGAFRFSVDTAAYRRLSQSYSWNWAEQSRVGKYPALQFTGRNLPVVTLQGTIYPEYKGGYNQMLLMRVQAELATPLFMIGCNPTAAQTFGKWVITSITDEHEHFWSDGSPRRMDFTIQLKHYPD